MYVIINSAWWLTLGVGGKWGWRGQGALALSVTFHVLG